MQEKRSLPTKLEFDKQLDEFKTLIKSAAVSPVEQAIVLSGLDLINRLIIKNKSYNSAVFKPGVLSPDLDPTASVRIRLNDQINRLNSLIGNPSVSNFSDAVKKTVFDMTGYGSLWYVLLSYSVDEKDLL